jgi:hypothetical protein
MHGGCRRGLGDTTQARNAANLVPDLAAPQSLGVYRTTASEVGTSCECPRNSTEHGRTNASKQFYNENHLRVGHTDV